MTLPKQAEVESFYNGIQVQVFVAALIGANFLTNIVEKEIDPKGNIYDDIFEGFNLFYNVAFTIELAINIYAHWWCNFWRSGWNIFDSVVVTIGLINMCKLPLPSAFSMLRMMRAFRVFRLFKRVKSLNKIIVAIVHAVPGVMNAFLILFIVMSIYAILAVELYTHQAEECKTSNITLPGFPKVGENMVMYDPVRNTMPWMTPRGGCFGPEYFGTFSRSFYTFFQVLTGESWSEMVARPAVWFWYYVPLKAVGGCLFFVSYILVTSFMLINVVVAVLLDKMSAPDIHEGDEDAEAAEETPDGEAEPDPQVSKDAAISDASTEATNGIKESSKIKQVLDIQQKVQQLVDDRASLRNNVDSFRGDMVDMKTKLANILEIVSSEGTASY
jgi:hypothetical protein